MRSENLLEWCLTGIKFNRGKETHNYIEEFVAKTWESITHVLCQWIGFAMASLTPTFSLVLLLLLIITFLQASQQVYSTEDRYKQNLT